MNRYGKGKKKPSLSSFKVNEMAVKNITKLTIDQKIEILEKSKKTKDKKK